MLQQQTELHEAAAAHGRSQSTAPGRPHLHPPLHHQHSCVHKPLLFPRLVGLDLATMVLVFTVAALALASGIGGGGIYVPALNLLLRFRTHVAVGLSQALICGGAIGALAVNARERHPATRDRPLIDYSLAAFLSPAEMAGAQVGVVLNQSLPAPVILAAMASLLSVLSVRTLRKGLAALAKERDMNVYARQPRGVGAGGAEEDAEEGKLLDDSSAGAAPPQPPRDHGRYHPHPSAPPSPPDVPPHAASSSNFSAPPQPLEPPPLDTNSSGGASSLSSVTPAPSWLYPLAAILGGAGHGADPPKYAAAASAAAAAASTSALAVGAGSANAATRTAGRHVVAPLCEVSLLCVVWVGLLGVLVARGRKGAPSLLGVRPCGPGYWAITAAGVVWLLVVCIAAGRRLVHQTRERQRLLAARRRAEEECAADGDDGAARFLEGDVRWDGVRAARAMVLAFVAGVVAGLVGVGGGMVLGPMMLELGVLPQVSSATTGTMVLLTSSSAAAVFLLGGLIPLDYAGGLALVAAMGGFAGKAGVAMLVKRYRASAFIILLLGGLIATSMLATTAAGILDLRTKYAVGELSVASLLPHAPCAA